MYFRCIDLFSMKYFKEGKLISGERGIYKEISWPYIKTTHSIKEWVNGKEIIFILYNKKNTDLKLLLEESIEKNLSGMVILTDEKDMIYNIEILELSNKKEFPIFILPWNIKLLNLTQEIILNIQKYREKNIELKKIFKEIINSPIINYEFLEKFYEISILNYNFIGIFENKYEDNIKEFYGKFFDKILKELTHKGFIKKNEIVYFSYGKKIVFLIFTDNIVYGQKIKDIIINIFKNYLIDKKHIYLSLSSISSNNLSIKEKYEITEKLSSLCEYNENVIDYENIGIYKLFIEIKGNKIVENYFIDKIKIIIDYDKVHKTNLLETINQYFFNNLHLINTSKSLGIHRNTLIYRINIVKELRKKDFSCSMENLELYNSILFYKFITKTKNIS